MASKKDRLSTGEKWLIGLTVTIVTLIGGAGWWWYESSVMPTYTPPPVTMPAVNANDDFTKAGLLCKTRVGKYDDRFYLMVIFNGEYRIPKPSTRTSSPVPPGPYPSPADIEMLVKTNEPAYQAMLQGFGKPHCLPTDYMQRPRNAGFLPRLVVCRGFVQRRHGDWNGATTTYLDGIEYGITKSQRAAYYPALAGISSQNLSRRDTWSAVSHLTPSQARSAARRLEGLQARQVTLKAVMECEQPVMLGEVYTWLRSPEWRGRGINPAYFSTKFHRRRIFNSYRRYARQCIAYASKPYALRDKEPAIPTLPPLFTYSTEDNFCKYTDNSAQNALLTVTFALRAYRLEHGAYPVEMKQLVPQYLTRIPDDPFALKRPLCYRKTAAGYLLYSVGPDGIDNGGIPSADGHTLAKGICPSSKGDIVAGVNLH